MCCSRGIRTGCLCTNGVWDVCAQPAPPCAGCGRVWMELCGVKVSEGWEREEGGWEESTCSSHMQDVSREFCSVHPSHI